jgi:hypothetical protein
MISTQGGVTAGWGFYLQKGKLVGFRDAKIGRTYNDSKPGTMAITKAPTGAPNVLINSDRRLGFRTVGHVRGTGSHAKS